MNRRNLFVFIGAAVASCAMAVAQAPSVTIDPSRHGNLAAAQDSVVQAWSRISDAQHANDSHLGGHAQRAKELLAQANIEIGLAADQADANQGDAPPPAPSAQNFAPAPSPAAPPNISGNWTIYAENTSQPGSSLKMVELSQDGNIISGTFHGPHQHGKLQGWINGNHVEFSTDTRDVLTFRGEITADGMSGLYGVHGQHAPWKAERSN
jgi:hypothetical protein